MSYIIAIAGATGNVGREILNILAERHFPLTRIDALASRRSLGREVSFGDTTLKVKALEHYDFAQADIAFFVCGSGPTAQYAPRAAAANCVVIDNSALYRMEPDVPLIVPEVNAAALSKYKNRNIIANPNCSTAQLVVALKPLHDAAQIQRIVMSTYQSVSGKGKKAMDELYAQTRALITNTQIIREQFPKQIAFNVIPHCGDFEDEGYTNEEAKLVRETHKILDPDIALTATCVRVPVFVGHAEAVNISFAKPLVAPSARRLLEKAPGICVRDHQEAGGYATPLDCVGDFMTFVSRIRDDKTAPNTLNLWIVSDNLRKGAALNAIQIAETLIETHRPKEAHAQAQIAR